MLVVEVCDADLTQVQRRQRHVNQIFPQAPFFEVRAEILLNTVVSEMNGQKLLIYEDKAPTAPEELTNVIHIVFRVPICLGGLNANHFTEFIQSQWTLGCSHKLENHHCPGHVRNHLG